MLNKHFKVHTLASGSKGNCILLQAGSTSILIDAGISSRQIVGKLGQLGVKPHELSGVFITHEHKDHINGLPVFAKRAQVPIFTREKTWLAMDCIKQIERSFCRLLPLTQMTIGDIIVKPFFISHDAAEPVGFSFFYKKEKCSLATDLGFVSDDVKKVVADSDVLILEANHDLKMLNEGSYPRFLKERIKGKQGHLSNLDAGNLLAQIVDKKLTDVFLAHLSQENNRPTLAKKTVNDILANENKLDKVNLYLSSQIEIVSNCKKESEVI